MGILFHWYLSSCLFLVPDPMEIIMKKERIVIVATKFSCSFANICRRWNANTGHKSSENDAEALKLNIYFHLLPSHLHYYRRRLQPCSAAQPCLVSKFPRKLKLHTGDEEKKRSVFLVSAGASFSFELASSFTISLWSILKAFHYRNKLIKVSC